jgi:hypothetical protein
LSGSVEATTIEGAKQIISIGPVASQEAIKLIGDNGGGFFNANSAHPFENPSVWSNILQNWSQLVLPVGLVFAFGRMVGDAKQERTLLIVMAVIFFVALAVFYWSEARGNPLLTALGVDPSLGNMEGKDLRFGQAGAALFVDATTGTGTGASKAGHVDVEFVPGPSLFVALAVASEGTCERRCQPRMRWRESALEASRAPPGRQAGRFLGSLPRRASGRPGPFPQRQDDARGAEGCATGLFLRSRRALVHLAGRTNPIFGVMRRAVCRSWST